MSALPGPANPIFYAQYHARGGTRNTLLVVIVYALAMGGLIFATAAGTEHRYLVDNLQRWLVGLITLQVFVLLVYGSFRVGASVRHDVDAKLLESHRLMPLGAGAAVLGYVLGAPVQALAVAAVNLLLGVLLAPAAGVASANWLLANGVLLAFSVMVWTVNAQISFAIKGSFALIMVAVLISAFTGGEILDVVPALGVITSPIIGRSAFDLTGPGLTADTLFAYAVSLLAQGVVTAVFFAAAMRKYRSSDSPAFDVQLGLLLLAALVAVSAVGLEYHDSFMPLWRRYGAGSDDGQATRFVGSLVGAMLVMIIPLAAAARARVQWEQEGPTPDRPRRPVAVILVVLAAVVVTGVLLRVHPRVAPPINTGPQTPVRVPVKLHNGTTTYTYTTPPPPPARRLAELVQEKAMAETVAMVLASGVAFWLLFTWSYRRRWKAWLVLLIWLAIVWVTPLVADVAQREASSEEYNPMGVTGTLSPIGSAAVAWDGRVDVAGVGVAFQWVMLVLPLTLVLTSGRKSARAGAAAVEVSAS